MISKQFIDECSRRINPPFTELGEFVFYRTYSRWKEEEQRRETWEEVCERAVNYNFSLQQDYTGESDEELREEAEKFYENMFGLKQFLSGRTLWVGGTEVSRKYPMANFNCAFVVVDSFKSFRDLFYLLMVGTGVGLRMLKEDVRKLPKVRQDVELKCLPYQALPKGMRNDYTTVKFLDEAVLIEVGDSKEGWVSALDNYLDIISDDMYKRYKKVYMDFSHVRPRGERLKTFGGTASGHETVRIMFEKIDKVIKGEFNEVYNNRLRPIHCVDIGNIIGENVVVGGVRRTSEMCLISPDDGESINAKKGIIGKPELYHRFMSNNSIFYKEKPSREQLEEQFKLIRENGEPSFINAQQAGKRRDNFEGVNPCGEVLLDNKGLCNLLTINVMGFVEDGKLNKKELMKAQRLSVRAGIRMTLPELELKEWDEVQKRDRLVGCSLTGWQDLIEYMGYDELAEKELLKELRTEADLEGKKFADKLGIERPMLVTTVKPEGTLSQLPTVSNGIHYSHSPYYIRRVRINSDDPLAQVAEELGWRVKVEVGQEWNNCNTKVIEFPVSSPAKKTKYDITAVEQLEIYKKFQKYYTQHNTSNTVSVKDEEWEGVIEWVWNNWDDVIGITFIGLDENGYELAPYEVMNEGEYNKRKSEMRGFSPKKLKLKEREREVKELDIGMGECVGSCPIR